MAEGRDGDTNSIDKVPEKIMAPNQRQRQLVLSKKELKKINGRRFSKYIKCFLSLSSFSLFFFLDSFVNISGETSIDSHIELTS